MYLAIWKATERQLCVAHGAYKLSIASFAYRRNFIESMYIQGVLTFFCMCGTRYIVHKDFELNLLGDVSGYLESDWKATFRCTHCKETYFFSCYMLGISANRFPLKINFRKRNRSLNMFGNHYTDDGTVLKVFDTILWISLPAALGCTLYTLRVASLADIYNKNLYCYWDLSFPSHYFFWVHCSSYTHTAEKFPTICMRCTLRNHLQSRSGCVAKHSVLRIFEHELFPESPIY